MSEHSPAASVSYESPDEIHRFAAGAAPVARCECARFRAVAGLGCRNTVTPGQQFCEVCIEQTTCKDAKRVEQGEHDA